MLLNCGVGEDSWGSLGQQGNPTKGKSVLNIHRKDWCWSWNSNTLDTSREELTRWKRPWCWEGLGAGGEGDDRGWDGWMTLPTRWAWVCVNSGSLWWTGRPGVLRFMGSQRVGHDWVTELNWTKTQSANAERGTLCQGRVALVRGTRPLWLAEGRTTGVKGEGRARDGSGQNHGVGASCPDAAGHLFSSTLGALWGSWSWAQEGFWMFLVFSHLEVNALPQVLFPGLNDLTELLKVRRPVQINYPSTEKKKKKDAKEHVKRCLTSLAIRDLYIITTVRYHSTPNSGCN